MSPIPRNLVKFTQRIRNSTLRNLTLNLVEEASQKPDLAHFTTALLKNPSHTSHTDPRPHATVLFATEEQLKNNKAQAAHIYHNEEGHYVVLYELGSNASVGLGLDRQEVRPNPSTHRLHIPPMNCSDTHPEDGLPMNILRLSERDLKFDVVALKKAIAVACGDISSDIAIFSKLSEGGFNRVFQATFKDGRCVIARLPYPSTVPEHYTVASEVATLDYLRLHGIRTPEVYGWCSTKTNPVGSEYIIMEKLGSTPLGDS
ncbi:hypothetical protein DTO271D3_5605 [Paecilomyces variotii]|nr:hypothetical protein DTO271D3_5605 [Paecilomyces variotii]